MPVHQFFSTLLRVLKWPAAFGAAICLPSALHALWHELFKDAISLTLVFVSALAYCILWWRWMRYWSISWLSTLEHELTHGLFAILTGHRIRKIHVTLRDGGHIQYDGSGNWLITLAPYFFPTATVAMIIAIALLPSLRGTLGQLLLGLTLGYHLTSTWAETHHAQTDLQSAGFGFSWLFLPAANATSLGLTLAAARTGWHGLSEWVEFALQSPVRPGVLMGWLLVRL